MSRAGGPCDQRVQRHDPLPDCLLAHLTFPTALRTAFRIAFQVRDSDLLIEESLLDEHRVPLTELLD